ncbi:hypothetical protein ACFL06_01920 [Patescibacteria group bacterium]
MKKKAYIISFTVLGILLQFILHAVLEIWYVNRLLTDFSTYNLGFSWNQLFLIHHIGTVLLLLAGVLFGFWQGNFWWKKIYNK